MNKISMYFTDGQLEFLRHIHEKSPEFDALTVSEHIRRAVDEYIERLKARLINVSSSKSPHGRSKA